MSRLLKTLGVAFSLAFAVSFSVVPASAETSNCPDGVQTVKVVTWGYNFGDMPLRVEHIHARNCLQFEFITNYRINERAGLLLDGSARFVSGIGIIPAIINRENALRASGKLPANYLDMRGVAVISIGTRSLYAVVGQQGFGSGQLSDLKGRTIAIARCGGDLPSHPTIALTDYLTRELASQGVRTFCGKPGDDPRNSDTTLPRHPDTGNLADTVYLEPIGFSTRRFTCVQSGDCAAAVLTTPQHLVMMANEPGKYRVYMQPQSLTAFPENSLVALAGNMKNPAFARLAARVRASIAQATAWLRANPASAVELIFQTGTNATTGSLKSMVSVIDDVLRRRVALDAYTFGVTHLWTNTGCVSREAMLSYGRLLGYRDPAAMLPRMVYEPNLCGS